MWLSAGSGLGLNLLEAFDPCTARVPVLEVDVVGEFRYAEQCTQLSIVFLLWAYLFQLVETFDYFLNSQNILFGPSRTPTYFHCEVVVLHRARLLLDAQKFIVLVL